MRLIVGIDQTALRHFPPERMIKPSQDIHEQAMNLTISAGRHDVHFQAGERLLDVLQANRIPVSYSCMAGRCGTCRCKLVAGQVRELDEQGRPLAAPQPGSYVLACQSFLESDCQIDIPDAQDIVVFPARTLKGTVQALDRVSHDICRLQLRVNRPMDYAPGQYAVLQFPDGLRRPYSMATTAGGDTLEFHIRLVPGGAASDWVGRQLKVGDNLKVSGPLGTSYLRASHGGPVICVAGGTGLAPVLCILRAIRERGLNNPLHVYVGARSQRDLYGLDWLQELAAQLPSMTLHVVLDEGGPAPFRTGRVTDALLQDCAAADLTDWRAYLCGAPAMVEAATRLLQQRRLNPERIHLDAFYPQTA